MKDVQQGENVRLGPHDLDVRVVLSSEEHVAPVSPDHILIHRKLHLPPELTVLLRAHGQPRRRDDDRLLYYMLIMTCSYNK